MIKVLFFILPFFGFAHNWGNWYPVKMHYDQKNYLKALEELKKYPLDSPSYFFNLGILNYHLGNLGKSRAYLEKASSLKPHHSEIKKNLSQIQSQWKLKYSELDAVSKREEILLEKLKSLSLGNIFGLLNLVSLILGIKIYTQNRNFFHTWKKPWVFLFLFSLLGLGFDSLINQWVSPPAFLLQNQVVRSGPSEDHPKLNSLAEGMKVRYLKQSNSWVQVRYSQQDVGWIPALTLLKL